MTSWQMEQKELHKERKIDFWRALNRAAALLQKAARSEAAVFEVFSEQLSRLGLHGSVSLLDDSGQYFVVQAIVFSDQFKKLVHQLEKVVGVEGVGYRYPLDAVKVDYTVLSENRAIFVHDNTEKIKEAVPPHVRRLGPVLKPFTHKPAILAPISLQSKAVGVLYIAGKSLRKEDVPAIAAFANHLSIALENARFFHRMQAAENQYRRMFKLAPDAIVLIDPHTFQIVAANPAVVEFTGYSQAQLEGMMGAELVLPAARAQVKQALRQVLKKGEYLFEVQVMHRNGRQRTIEVSMAKIENNGRELIQGFGRDVTEARQAERLQSVLYRIATVAHAPISLDALYKKIHEILDDLMDVRNFYIALYDAATDTMTLPYFVDEKDGGFQSYTYKGGRGLTDYVMRTGIPHLLTVHDIRRLLQQGEIELRGTMPQVWLGIPLQLSSETIGALVVQNYENLNAYTKQEKEVLSFVSSQVATVIAHKRAEEALKELALQLKQQALMFDTILSTTPDSFAVNDLDGRYLYANKRILEIYGRTLDELVGKTWQELDVPAPLMEQAESDRLRVIKTKEPVTRVVEFSSEVGDMVLEYTFSPIIDEDGVLTGTVSTGRDITTRRETMELLNHAQKLESLGVLAGGVAHDFNNLLVAILGQSSLAMAKMETAHPAHNHVEKVVQAAENAAALTRQLLAYSGRGQFTVKPLNLNQLILENQQLLQVTMSKNVTLRLDLADHLPLIEADNGQIQQIIMNLVLNGSEATEQAEGQIEIITDVCRITEEDDAFWQQTNQPLTPGDYVSLSVRDNGSGMAPETLKKIFDPFFTTKFTGRGLGLAAVLGIVRGHRSGIKVCSEKNVGTTFTLVFPISPQKTLTAVEDKVKQKMKKKRSVILVIDDEKAVREAVKDILEMEQIDVLAAGDGQTGIQTYQDNRDVIDLVLLDLSMPGMRGEDTYKGLRQIDPDVRVILTSGYSESDAIRGFDGDSLVGFLQKPYRLDRLLEVVVKHLDAGS